MQLWIDGFNFFYRWPPTAELFARRENIPEALDAAVRLLTCALPKRKNALLFLDGGKARGSETRHGLRLLYAGPGGKADDVLLEKLRGTGNRRNVRVVTDDRQLASLARTEGAGIIRLEEFCKSLNSGGKNDGRRQQEQVMKEKKLEPFEVDAWLEIFENDVEN
jgi:hypothetical protein